MKFSANLGYLWKDLPLPDAIRAAARAGFDAVECHQPYRTPARVIRDTLAETGLSMMSLNTDIGTHAGDMGLAAIPGREKEARELIDQAVSYAAATETRGVHVVAGLAQGRAALETFRANLDYACTLARPHGITVLIEPLNPFDVPGYAIWTTAQAVGLIRDQQHSNLKLMFDFYHVHRTEGDVFGKLKSRFDHIGHIQFAGPPDRGWPDRGALDYRQVFQALSDLGWDQPIGAEYRTDGPTEASLGWMQTLTAPA